MNALLRKYLGSLIRAGFYALAAILIDKGWMTTAQQDQLATPLVETLVGVALGLLTLLWSLLQKHAQEQLFHTALKADPKAPPEDVVQLVQRGFGASLSWLGKFVIVLAIVALPAVALAQPGPIQASVPAIVHQVVTEQPAPSPPAVPAGLLGVPEDTWLRFAEGAFIAGNIADFATTYVALRQKDTTGVPVNAEANPLLPNSATGILTVKLGVIGGGLIAAEKLWDSGHKWEAILALAGASAATFAASMNNVYEITKPGIYPAPTTVAARRR